MRTNLHRLSEEEVELFHSTIRPYAPVTGRNAGRETDDSSLLLKFSFIGLRRHSPTSGGTKNANRMEGSHSPCESTPPENTDNLLAEVDPADIEEKNESEEENLYQFALLTLFDESKMSRQSTEKTAAKYESKSGEKWISENVRFDIKDCTIPLHTQANVMAPGGTGAKLEKYKLHTVLSEDRRLHKIVWNETYLPVECVRTAVKEPFCTAEMDAVFAVMRAVASSKYCEGFTY